MIKLVTPSFGESVSEATLGEWLKKEGDILKKGEIVVIIESDKAALELTAPESGLLSQVNIQEGTDITPGTILAIIDESIQENPADKQINKPTIIDESIQENSADKQINKPEQSTPSTTNKQISPIKITESLNDLSLREPLRSGPAAKKIMEENQIDPKDVIATGNKNTITRNDVVNYIQLKNSKNQSTINSNNEDEIIQKVKMSRLRRTIAKRLKEAQDTAAILTTFNDVDMSSVINLRKTYQEQFIKKYNIKLGFMGFFAKACTQALIEFPDVNAEINDNEIIYKKFVNLGIAVSTTSGLVVPVIKNAHLKSIAQIEKEIVELATAARNKKLTLEQMSGGTFTITNGGIYGSMLSTPILNRPQSGILGMHRIEERPVVKNGEIVAKPMMYLALSYDHRIVDGRDSVTFLARVKSLIEDPVRLTLDV